MNKLISFIFILLFCAFTSFAQEKTGSREKIKSLKIAYLTEQLNLTSAEAQKFWPIYNAYYEEYHSLRNKMRSKIKEKESLTTFSESDAEKLVLLKLSTDKEIYEAQKKFINSIKNIISYKKIIQLQLAEREFGRNLMRKYKHKKSENRKNKK